MPLSKLDPEKSDLAFVRYASATFPGQGNAFTDNTHFNACGGNELARCVIENIHESMPELAAHLAPDAARFDPYRPYDPETFLVARSPLATTISSIPNGDGR